MNKTLKVITYNDMLLHPLLGEFQNELANIPQLSFEMQSIYFIMNRLPRSQVGLSFNTWRKDWSVLISVLHEIGRLSHPDEEFDDNEPDPEGTLDFTSTQHKHTKHNYEPIYVYFCFLPCFLFFHSYNFLSGHTLLLSLHWS